MPEDRRVSVNGVYNAGDIHGDVVVNNGPAGPRDEVRSIDDFAALVSRVCFAFDVVGFSLRRGADRERILEMLPAMTRLPLSRAGVEPEDCLIQDKGDGANIALPMSAAPTEVFDGLVDGWRAAIPFAQRVMGSVVRVRVAFAYSEVSTVPGSPAWKGRAPIQLSRQLESPELRHVAQTSDLSISVSEALHALVVAEGYSALGRTTERSAVWAETRGVRHRVFAGASG